MSGAVGGADLDACCAVAVPFIACIAPTAVIILSRAVFGAECETFGTGVVPFIIGVAGAAVVALSGAVIGTGKEAFSVGEIPFVAIRANAIIVSFHENTAFRTEGNTFTILKKAVIRTDRAACTRSEFFKAGIAQTRAIGL